MLYKKRIKAFTKKKALCDVYCWNAQNTTLKNYPVLLAAIWPRLLVKL